VFLLVIGVFLSWPSKTIGGDFFTDAVDHYRRVTEGVLEAPGVGSLAPTARILDLSPWGYQVLARHSQRFGGYQGRLFVYQGEQNEYLLAQEYEGAEIKIPTRAKATKAANLEFVSYSEGGVNLVAWKDKDLLCIIASSLPQEKLLHLAQQIATPG
jgi:hypothetical protein